MTEENTTDTPDSPSEKAAAGKAAPEKAAAPARKAAAKRAPAKRAAEKAEKAEKSASKDSKEQAAYLLVTQVRSSIGTKPKHRGSLRALGLRGIGRTRVLPDRPEVRGMIARVPHLVEVGPATAEQASTQLEASKLARDARRART
jgi:large subunit ribosomal protein L30